MSDIPETGHLVMMALHPEERDLIETVRREQRKRDAAENPDAVEPPSVQSTFYQTHQRESKRAGLKGQQRTIEVRWETIPDRLTDDGGQQLVDEIVTQSVHLEMMDEANCWMDVQGLRVWFRAVRIKGEREPRLWVTASPESCAPVAPATAGGGREATS